MRHSSRKKRKHQEHDNHDRWLVSYADFITLMFAFFVIMYATSNNNEEKQKKFQDSVRADLNLSAGGSGRGQSQNALSDTVQELAQPIAGFPKDGAEAEDYVEKELDKKISSQQKNAAIPGVHHDVMGLRITLAASAFFPTGSAKLKREALPVLDQVAEILRQTPKKVIIEGHTDNIAFEGPNGETNWELASNRANSVVRYLVKVHKIDPKRMAAISYADQKPIVPNISEENRAKNRRIEVLIANDER